MDWCDGVKHNHFLSKKFCLTVPKKIGKPFNCSEKIMSNKFVDKRGGMEGVSRTSVKNSLSHSVKKVLGETFSVTENF